MIGQYASRHQENLNVLKTRQNNLEVLVNLYDSEKDIMDKK